MLVKLITLLMRLMTRRGLLIEEQGERTLASVEAYPVHTALQACRRRPLSARARTDRSPQGTSTSGPLALRGAKRIVAARQEPGFKAARELSDALRAALEWSHDIDECIAAHKENRPPKFIGR